MNFQQTIIYKSKATSIANTTKQTLYNPLKLTSVSISVLMLLPALLALSSPLTHAKLTIVRTPIASHDAPATSEVHLPHSVVAASSGSDTPKRTVAPPVAPPIKQPMMDNAGTQPSQTLKIDEVRTLTAVKQSATVSDVTSTYSKAKPIAIPSAETQAQPSILNPEPIEIEPITALVISNQSVKPQATPPLVDDIVIATPNQELPSSLDKNIHMPTITLSLKDLLAILEAYSPVDMTLAREVDEQKTNRITSVRSVKLKQLLENALHADRLTFKSIGQDLVFIYNDDAYSHCIYNRIDADSEHFASSESQLREGNASAIRTDDKTIGSTLDFIAGFEDKQVYIDSGLLFPYSGTSINETTDSINLRNKSLTQMLAVLSYRNGLNYQYVGDNILLITENPNLEVCKGFLDNAKD